MYLDHVMEMLQKISSTQEKAMEETAEKMAETIVSGGSIFLFGPGHAGIFTQDMYIGQEG